MSESICKVCRGQGTIDRDGKIFECQCAFIKRMATTMPSFLRKAEIRAAHLELPVLRAFKRHVMVVAAWPDMKAVIKAVMLKNPAMFIKITSDREIRDVYVGSKSKAAKGEDNGSIYNSLEDLMDPPALMIVRLNELSYKNKAASGALEEAISYRTDRDRPTWLYNDMDKPFTMGSIAYSDSIADLIKTNFPVTRINRILSTPSLDLDSLDDLPQLEIADDPKPTPILVAEPQAAVAKVSRKPLEISIPPPPDEVEEAPRKPSPRPRPKIRPSDDDDSPLPQGLSMYGSGNSSSSKFRKGK